MEIITSIDNSFVKEARSLQEKKYRKLHGKFIIEGPKFVRDAINAGAKIDKIFVLSTKIADYIEIIDMHKEKVYAVSERVFSKITDTENSQGILAVAFLPKQASIIAGEDILVLDRISDPGNMGTIIRTAAATGYKTLLTIDSVDAFSPKVVRSSAGCLFNVNIYQMTEPEVLDFTIKNKYNLMVADARGKNIFKMDKVKPPSALVIGNEANGPSDAIKNAATTLVSLPMKKNVESLNASVSASVLMYLIKKDNI